MNRGEELMFGQMRFMLGGEGELKSRKEEEDDVVMRGVE